MAGQLAGQPIYILREGSQRTKGKEAQNNNIMAARAVAAAVRTTLGPQGMDKMLVDSMGDIIITNDGATILQTMDIGHPAAKMILEDKDLLLKLAVTTITGKGAEASKDVFAILAVNAILAVVNKENGKYTADIEDIKIEKKVGGSIEASELIEGMVIDKERGN